MGKRNSFNQKGKLDSLVAPVAKEKFMTPTLGLEQDVYFTWGAVSDATRYSKLVNKLKDCVAVHFWYQSTVAVRAMGGLKAPTFVKFDCPVRVYWDDEGQTHKTNNKRNADSFDG